MNDRSFQQSQPVPCCNECALLDSEEDIYFSVEISHSSHSVVSKWFRATASDLVEVILLPLRGRRPAEVATAITSEPGVLDGWLRDYVSDSTVVQFAQAVAAVEWWMRESQRFDHLCELDLPEGYYVTAHLYLGHSQWSCTPICYPIRGEWCLADKDDPGTMSEGNDPIAALTAHGAFGAPFVAAWTHPLTVARETVEQFRAGKMRASELMARIEPKIPRNPAPVTSKTLPGPERTSRAVSRFLRVISKIVYRQMTSEKGRRSPCFP